MGTVTESEWGGTRASASVDDSPRLRDSTSARLVCRGIRGATTVDENTAEAILEATHDLLLALIRLNDLDPADIASAFFTTTVDLSAAFPAVAARDLGWSEVPLLCAHEMDVPGALGRVVRVLLHINTTRSAGEIRHVYLRGARELRPAWALADDDLDALLERPTFAVGAAADRS